MPHGRPCRWRSRPTKEKRDDETYIRTRGSGGSAGRPGNAGRRAGGPDRGGADDAVRRREGVRRRRPVRTPRRDGVHGGRPGRSAQRGDRQPRPRPPQRARHGGVQRAVLHHQAGRHGPRQPQAAVRHQQPRERDRAPLPDLPVAAARGRSRVRRRAVLPPRLHLRGRRLGGRRHDDGDAARGEPAGGHAGRRQPDRLPDPDRVSVGSDGGRHRRPYPSAQGERPLRELRDGRHRYGAVHAHRPRRHRRRAPAGPGRRLGVRHVPVGRRRRSRRRPPTSASSTGSTRTRCTS